MIAFIRKARLWIFVVALCGVVANGAAQPVSSSPISPATIEQPRSEDFWKWSVTQGGLAIVLLIVLWSYRRDFDRIQKKDDDRAAVMTDLVGDCRAEIQASVDMRAMIVQLKSDLSTTRDLLQTALAQLQAARGSRRAGV